MSLAVLRKEKDKEGETFLLQHEIKKYREELNKLLEKDHRESKTIQDLSLAKRELNQAQKELIIYREGGKEINLEKADERRNYTIPSLKKQIQELEAQASQNEL